MDRYFATAKCGVHVYFTGYGSIGTDLRQYFAVNRQVIKIVNTQNRFFAYAVKMV
jgi:hypothetical protein